MIMTNANASSHVKLFFCNLRWELPVVVETSMPVLFSCKVFIEMKHILEVVTKVVHTSKCCPNTKLNLISYAVLSFFNIDLSFVASHYSTSHICSKYNVYYYVYLVIKIKLTTR